MFHMNLLYNQIKLNIAKIALCTDSPAWRAFPARWRPRRCRGVPPCSWGGRSWRRRGGAGSQKSRPEIPIKGNVRFIYKKTKTSHSLDSNLYFLHYILFSEKNVRFLETNVLKYPGLTKRWKYYAYTHQASVSQTDFKPVKSNIWISLVFLLKQEQTLSKDLRHWQHILYPNKYQSICVNVIDPTPKRNLVKGRQILIDRDGSHPEENFGWGMKRILDIQKSWPWPLVYLWGHDLKVVLLILIQQQQQQQLSPFYDLTVSPQVKRTDTC